VPLDGDLVALGVHGRHGEVVPDVEFLGRGAEEVGQRGLQVLRLALAHDHRVGPGAGGQQRVKPAGQRGHRRGAEQFAA
jgi:hypothetical protein